MDNQPLQKAIQLIQSGDLAAAVAILSQLVFANPHDEDAWNWLIQALPPERRLQAAEMYVKQNPKSAAARRILESVTPPPLNPVLKAVKVPVKPQTPSAETPPANPAGDVQALRELARLPGKQIEEPLPSVEDEKLTEGETAGDEIENEAVPDELPADRQPPKRWLIPVSILVFATGFAIGIFGMLYQGRYFTRSAFLAAETNQVKARLIVASVSAIPTKIPSPTAVNTPTPHPSRTPEPTGTPTIIPSPAAGDRMLSKMDGAPLVFVPAGQFTMGWNGGEADEGPEHQVNLSAYWIDVREVTNAMYALCVQSGECTTPAKTSSYKQPKYYGNAEYEPYPVIDVTWAQAAAYCAWAGRRLPSEAEWEKAASGSRDERAYPWGDQPPTNDLANFGYLENDTIPSGVMIKGASPYGVMDLAGNVSEWVNDLYAVDYYRNSPADNPPGAPFGKSHVYRGGAFGSSAAEIRLTRRSHASESFYSFSLGFRCAMSARSEATPVIEQATNSPTGSSPITATP